MPLRYHGCRPFSQWIEREKNKGQVDNDGHLCLEGINNCTFVCRFYNNSIPVCSRIENVWQGAVFAALLFVLSHNNRVLIHFKLHFPGSFDKFQHVSNILMFLDVQRVRNFFQLLVRVKHIERIPASQFLLGNHVPEHI